MEEFFNTIPDWVKIVFGVGTGAGGGGFGVHKWYKTKLLAEQQDFNQESEYRDELRGDVDKLRKRQEQYEIELAESRNKYFEMQEKYHELKLEYNETLVDNKKLREEISKLRDEIRQLREKLNS